MRNFSINLRGRVNNFNLPKNQPLIPLFEAIVNSIHAIADRKKNGDTFDGRIVIRILRDDQTVLSGSDELPRIQSFEIIDNGIGFIDENLVSFMESDSTYKASIGGKGVGRFSWLIAFKRAEINSYYKENGRFYNRKFCFSLDHDKINDAPTEIENQDDNCTVVRLEDCIAPYSASMPKRARTIAMRIVEHCLVYFLADDCPQIDLFDDIDGYNLNHFFHRKIQADSTSSTFTIENVEFDLLHVKAKESTINGNKLYLCAHNRLVETRDLDKYIVDLDRAIYENGGFWYVGVLRSRYLDDSVDMNRLSFSIPDRRSSNETSAFLTMDKIMDSVVRAVNEFLKDYLQPIATSKKERVKEYVTHKAPQFRHLLKYMPKEIDAIKPNLSDDGLDDELYRIKRQFDRQISSENEQLLTDLNKGILSTEEYISKFGDQVEKVTSANGSALAEYVAHRKVILDLMEFAIKKKEDGKFQRESFLHNLIYPMRSTSEELPYNNHNLWLIDEKMAYCSYISSDIAFNNSTNQERTDILILDRPVAVSDEENRGREYECITIFELKRPMRDDYNGSTNPIDQLYGYVTKLKTNQMRDKDGRIIRVGANTKFYLYAVCDITRSLEQILDFRDFSQTPDKMGYYRYNGKLNSYIEVLSYDKIISDAQKRNQILFDKLGI